ncbi:MAG: hypothetical protein Q8O91_02915 [Candidatus Aminicenantes bacterium]|nr:hypothetical protein [Candidatus Aminicenantes bacterium]
MNKNHKLSTLVVVLFFIIASAGMAFALAGQTASVQAQGEVQKTSDQAKVEAQDQKAKLEKEIQAAQTRAELDRQKMEAIRVEFEIVVKTYVLKYISASEFMRSAKFYVIDSSGTETTLTVKIYKKNIADFEALLKKLDVEKKNIQFQVYTIVASKEAPLERFKNNFVTETKDIADKDLKRVLDEMKGLWNFKFYWVDSPSFLVVKDGAAGSLFKLVSNPYDFDMNVLHVQLRGDEPGKRIISVGQIKLNQSINMVRSTLIDTSDVTFKEKGYLVVGVSGFNAGWSGSALILVISAEIK